MCRGVFHSAGTYLDCGNQIHVWDGYLFGFHSEGPEYFQRLRKGIANLAGYDFIEIAPQDADA
jgi:hypothetical protein